MSKYIDYITEKLGKKLIIEYGYRKTHYSHSCSIKVKGSGSRRHVSGGTNKEDMTLSALEGIVKSYDKKYPCIKK